MAIETIKVGKQDHQIEVKPLTVICPSAEASCVKIEYPGRVPLDAEITTYHAQRVKKLHTEFEKVWRFFMENTSKPTPVDYEVTADRIRQMGAGAIHLMGLIDMSLKFRDLKIPMVWVHPETFLHPSWAVALGDLAIFFAGAGK